MTPTKNRSEFMLMPTSPALQLIGRLDEDGFRWDRIPRQPRFGIIRNRSLQWEFTTESFPETANLPETPKNRSDCMNSRSVITTTVGYMCLALAGWLVSMPNAAWFDRPAYGYGLALVLPLAAIVGVMGILAFIHEGALNSIIFFGGAGLYWSHHAYHRATLPAAADPGSYAGWYFFVWAVFFCYVWIGSLRAGVIRMLFLLGLWLTLLALAIGHWASSHGITVLGGYLGLATAILAAIESAKTVIRNGLSTNAA